MISFSISILVSVWLTIIWGNRWAFALIGSMTFIMEKVCLMFIYLYRYYIHPKFCTMDFLNTRNIQKFFRTTLFQTKRSLFDLIYSKRLRITHRQFWKNQLRWFHWYHVSVWLTIIWRNQWMSTPVGAYIHHDKVYQILYIFIDTILIRNFSQWISKLKKHTKIILEFLETAFFGRNIHHLT